MHPESLSRPLILWVASVERGSQVPCMAQGDVDIGLENAGAYLGDTFGPLMRVIWAVGLLAAGARGPSVSLALVPTASH